MLEYNIPPGPLLLDPTAPKRHFYQWMDPKLLLLREGTQRRDILFSHDPILF